MVELLSLRKFVRFVTYITLLTVFLTSSSTVFAQSFNQGDLDSILGTTPFFDPACAGSDIPNDTTTQSTSSSECCNQSSDSGSAAVAPGSGSPNGSTFPNLDPNAMATAINTYIQKTNSNSEMAGLGSTIVASANHSNVSPFIIVAIAQKESSLSSPSDFNVAHAHNSFGRGAGPGQPSFQGARSWYYWSSVKASVDYTAPENQGIKGGGDFASFLRYQYGSALDSDNLLSFFEVYNPVSDGGNPPAYAALVQSIINTISGQSAGGGSSTSTSSGSTSSCGGSLSVSCNTDAAATSDLSTTRQNVVCIAESELAVWASQPGYPWHGTNSYSESAYLKYSQGRHEEWCADFTTWVYDQAKYPLKPDPNWNIAYVPNIQAVGQQNQSFHWHPEASYNPKPGDIAIHGANHVNIVVSNTNGTITMIGGDQGQGPYPGGSIVSTEVATSPHGQGITGYVTPD